MKANKYLYKSKVNKILAGVFGGVGEYFNIDPTLLRLTWIIITVFTGFFPGIIAYIVSILIVPSKTEGMKNG